MQKESLAESLPSSLDITVELPQRDLTNCLPFSLGGLTFHPSVSLVSLRRTPPSPLSIPSLLSRNSSRSRDKLSDREETRATHTQMSSFATCQKIKLLRRLSVGKIFCFRQLQFLVFSASERFPTDARLCVAFLHLCDLCPNSSILWHCFTVTIFPQQVEIKLMTIQVTR